MKSYVAAWRVPIVMLVLLAFGHVVSAQPSSPRFCLLPVTSASTGDGAAITNHIFQFQGLPAPVFTSSGAGPWTIDAKRHLVRYEGAFPRTAMDPPDHAVAEPWSGRGVAITFSGGVSVLSPGGDRFVAVDGPEPRQVNGYIGISVHPRRRLTIVTTGSGIAYLVEGDHLRPWLSAAEMAAHGMRGVYSTHDAASLSATIVVDQDRGMHVLTDRDVWYRVGQLTKDDYGSVFDAPGSGAALLLANRSVLAIRENNNSNDAPFHAETLATAPNSGASFGFVASALFGRVLTFDRGRGFDFAGPRWRQLTAAGFADVPGGDIGAASGSPFLQPQFHDLPTLGRSLVEGRDGLFLFDGETIFPVAGSGRDHIGERPWVYDLPSIGRVIVATRFGLFELTRDATLVALKTPFPADGLPMPELANWPGQDVALAATRAGIYTLDRNLNASPVPGGDQIDLRFMDFAFGVTHPNSEMLLAGRRGPFIALNDERAADHPCQSRQELEQKIPLSNICVRPVPRTGPGELGFAIGDMIETPKGDGLLIDAIGGLFHMTADGAVTPMLPRGGQYTRTLTALPWSSQILASGGGETIIDRDLSIETLSWPLRGKYLGAFPSLRSVLIETAEPALTTQLLHVDGADHKLIDMKMTRGDLRVIVDAPWWGSPIVSNRSGLFSVDPNGVLIRFEVQAHANSVASPMSPDGISFLFSVSRFKTIYAWRNGWFLITRNREWRPLQGLPDVARVLAIFDPGEGAVLFGTNQGVFAVEADGSVRALRGGGAPALAIRAFAKRPVGGGFIGGGDEGLFEIPADLSAIAPVTNGSADQIGAVRKIADAGFGGFVVVTAANGAYEFDGNGLRAIRVLSTAAGLSDVSVFPRLRRVLVTKPFANGPLLHELGREDEAGHCAGPLATAGR